MTRKRGGQPGNENAVTHGRYSHRRREERAAKARQRDDRLQTIPKTDYAAICDRIAKEKTE